MSNPFEKTRAYLGGHIEYSKNGDWRTEFARTLKDRFDIIPLSPLEKCFVDQQDENEELKVILKEKMRAEEFYEVSTYMKEIIRKDLRLIDISDFCIFYLEPENATFGSVHEIIVAAQQRKPVLLVINDRSKTPLWLMGIINSHYIFDSLSAVINYLTDICLIKAKFDSKYWKFLLPGLR